MAFETQSSAPRARDTAGLIQAIKTFAENADGSGEQIQAIALTGLEGVKAGVPALPLHVQGAVLTAIEAALGPLATQVTLEAVRVLLASLDAVDFATQTTLALLLTELQLKADLTETQPVEEQEVPPTDAAKNNPSFVFTYTNGDLTGIAMTIGITTYNRALAYTNGDLTSMTVWS